MKKRMTRMAGFLLLVLVALSSAGCQLFFEPKGELYLSLDGKFGTVTCELYMVKYLEVGRSASTGKNIFGNMLRKETISGREWMVYEVPKGRWDIYMEYFTHDAYRPTNTKRVSINLELNEWSALWFAGTDWLSPKIYEGDGAVSIPNL